MELDLTFVDAKLVKSCNCCKVNGFAIEYRLGKIPVKCYLEDNTYTKGDKKLIEWFLN